MVEAFVEGFPEIAARPAWKGSAWGRPMKIQAASDRLLGFLLLALLVAAPVAALRSDHLVWLGLLGGVPPLAVLGL